MGLLTAALSFGVDVALGAWLGVMLFFSFIGAPRAFAVLDDRAAEYVSAVFPLYYGAGLALGTIAFLAAIGWGIVAGFGLRLGVLFFFVGAGILLTGVARWVLLPRMDDAGDAAFDRYHRYSVILNGLTMWAVALGLVASHV